MALIAAHLNSGVILVVTVYSDRYIISFFPHLHSTRLLEVFFFFLILWSLKPISVRPTVVLSRTCDVNNNVRNNDCAACC